MIHLTVLASGSSGNSIFVRTRETSVLVDAGISARQLESQLKLIDVSTASLSGILLTHEHGDHTRGLKVFCSKNPVPVFTNQLTAHRLKENGLSTDWHFFSGGSAFALGDFTITPFSVPHDAADPVGFVLSNGTSSVAILTDLGYSTRNIVAAVRGVNAIVIEANHDEALLQNDTKRPWSVKQRIMSRHGHLSNQAAANLVAEVATERLRHILLAHLSEDCNSAELAQSAIREKLPASLLTPPSIQCPGTPDHPTPLSIAIEG
jgi:phosphoribosyl 1,2-cyclic phosphodiesterase